jgi:hypothetical protein
MRTHAGKANRWPVVATDIRRPLVRLSAGCSVDEGQIDSKCESAILTS